MVNISMAEGVGFEPTAPCGVTGFQDRLLKPLGHPSIDQQMLAQSVLYHFFASCQSRIFS